MVLLLGHLNQYMYIDEGIIFYLSDNWKKRKAVGGDARLSRSIKDCNIWRWQGISMHQPDLLITTTSLQIYLYLPRQPYMCQLLTFSVLRLWNSRWICVVTDALIRLWYVDKCIEMHKDHMSVYIWVYMFCYVYELELLWI